MSRRPHEYLLSVGSNIEPARWIPFALDLLAERVEVVAASPWYAVPAEGRSGQPDFVNLAIRVRTDLPPRALRTAMRSLEARCGRVRSEDRYAPRTLDVDVVFGSADWPASERLPDPDLTRAGYVLVPCADVWPEAVDPASGRTLRDLVEAGFAAWAAEHRRVEEA
ncbi:MAG: 2-amino-4-hydroxy-6-hydroxymethyldihydropteridine diphosphokinase [Planctomycetota bacterium]|nr:2-amino-4-hydroxy-6-hydroxymethyldihydropteridine diphosphokinase [Planctomycetota bacterium]